MTPRERAQLETAARRWFFDGYPIDPVHAAQLLVFMQMDGDVAELHAEILAEKARLYDEWLAAGLGLVELYANGDGLL